MSHTLDYGIWNPQNNTAHTYFHMPIANSSLNMVFHRTFILLTPHCCFEQICIIVRRFDFGLFVTTHSVALYEEFVEGWKVQYDVCMLLVRFSYNVRILLL